MTKEFNLAIISIHNPYEKGYKNGGVMLISEQQVINDKLLKSSVDVYNNYLLLYKLNELKLENSESLKSAISYAIDQNQNEVKFGLEGKEYSIFIKEDKNNKYNLEVIGNYDSPKIKDISQYNGKNVIEIWAKSKVSFEKSSNNNHAFAVEIKDKARNQDLKIGGQGKKVPFSLRFANFYRVIKILKDTNTKLQEKLRLANNMATGSGKTGDIAMLKLSCYLASIPCITVVPTEALKEQASNFDKEFLPNKVAQEFAEPFSETNAEYATTTFSEVFNTEWNLLNNTYGKNKSKPALILTDEAPNLKGNVVYLARAKEISKYNPIAIFTATPDKFLSEEFNISDRNQILLSPKERAELGIGKLPRVYLDPIKFLGESVIEAYIKKVDNTHEKLSSCDNAIAKFQEERKEMSDLSNSFLNLINESLDSQAYKTALIAVEQRDSLEIRQNIFFSKREQNRKEEKRKSFVSAIRELELGLEDSEIESLVNENLNIEVGKKLYRSIKLHNIIDTFNEYKKSGMEVREEEVSKFIKDKYGIVDYVDHEYQHDNLPYNKELTRSICTLDTIEVQYQESIERNYPGDKKFHEHMFKTYPKLTAFCENDLCLSYFQDSFGLCYTSKKNANLLNMVKAGFVPVTLSKELGIGIDAPRLNSAAAIITSFSDILDPMFLLQLMGRIGRNVSSSGLCYFDLFTTTKSFLNVSNIVNLSGKDLCKALLDSYQEYIISMDYIIEAKSRALCDFIMGTINEYEEEREILKLKPRVWNYINAVDSYIIKEFKNININYGFNKEISMKLFTKVLKSAYSELKNFHTHCIIADNVIDGVIEMLESQNASIQVRDYINDRIPSLVLWVRKIIQTQPICGDELLNADSRYKDPIFIKQNTKDEYKKVIEDIESYAHKSRDIRVKLPHVKKESPAFKLQEEYHMRAVCAIDGLADGEGNIKEAISKIEKLDINYANPDENGGFIIRLALIYPEILSYFIKNGLNVSDDKLNLVISICKRRATPEANKVLEMLIEKGAKVDAQDDHGNTALHAACKNGYRGLAEILIENGANVTGGNKEGHTPLYLAAQNDDLSCAKFLIEWLLKADSNIEMPLLLNEDKELLEHWSSCKKNIIKRSTSSFQVNQPQRTRSIVASNTSNSGSKVTTTSKSLPVSILQPGSTASEDRSLAQKSNRKYIIGGCILVGGVLLGLAIIYLAVPSTLTIIASIAVFAAAVGLASWYVSSKLSNVSYESKQCPSVQII